MDEGAALAVGRLLSRCGIFEGFDDGLEEQRTLVSMGDRLDILRFKTHTVFPDPLYPTMRVNGALNFRVSGMLGLKERILLVRPVSKRLVEHQQNGTVIRVLFLIAYPRICNFSILALKISVNQLSHSGVIGTPTPMGGGGEGGARESQYMCVCLEKRGGRGREGRRRSTVGAVAYILTNPEFT